MKIKEVRDEFGIIRLVDEEKRKIYDYSNRKKIVTWNAPIVEDGQDSHFWCSYQERGMIAEIDTRMQTWRNGVNKSCILNDQFVIFPGRKAVNYYNKKQ